MPPGARTFASELPAAGLVRRRRVVVVCRAVCHGGPGQVVVLRLVRLAAGPVSDRVCRGRGVLAGQRRHPLPGRALEDRTCPLSHASRISTLQRSPPHPNVVESWLCKAATRRLLGFVKKPRNEKSENGSKYKTSKHTHHLRDGVCFNKNTASAQASL